MLNKELLDSINKKITSTFGLNITGQPKFKLVWSDNEVEVRFGTFDKYYGDIYCGSWTGVKEVKKYADIEGKYILEYLVPANNPELTTLLSYEPVYVFHDRDGNSLPLNWDVISIVCTQLLNPPRREYRTEEMDRKEDRRKFEKEKQRNLDYLNAVGDSDLVKRLKLKTAILNAGAPDE